MQRDKAALSEKLFEETRKLPRSNRQERREDEARRRQDKKRA